MYEEDALLNKIAIEQALGKLSAMDRDIIRVTFYMDRPTDWGALAWPPTYADTGQYIGLKHKGKVVSEGTIRQWRSRILRSWALNNAESL